jgi:hypothetical protein
LFIIRIQLFALAWQCVRASDPSGLTRKRRGAQRSPHSRRPSPLVYLPALRWRPVFVPLPPRERIVWTDTETIAREEDWVDTNYGVDASGSALYLDMSGKTKLNFAEVTFDDGHVQVVDFNEETHDPGVYKLLDVNRNQHVATVRIWRSLNRMTRNWRFI